MDAKSDKILLQHEALLNCIDHPAFLVRDEKILLGNYCADNARAEVEALLANRAVSPGMHVERGKWRITARNCGGDTIVLASSSAQRTAAVASASRAIREPLAGLYAALTSLKEEFADDPRVAKRLAEIHHDFYRLLRAQENIETVSGGQIRITAKRGDLTALITRVCEDAQHAAKINEMRICADVGSKPLYIHMDAEQIERALLNMISNAIRFGVRGGTIEVRTALSDDYVRVEVRNEAAEEQDPWEELTGSSERLGTMVMRMIARAHGGALLTERRGNVFCSRLVLAMYGGSDAVMESPVMRCGSGFNRLLVELSDVLSAADFDPRGIW